MIDPVETRRLVVILAVAFGIASTTPGVIVLTGGPNEGVMVAPGIPLALVLVAGPYMFAPAIANLATRLLTGEGFDRMLLRPQFRVNGRVYLIAWLAPVGLIGAGAAIYFLVFPLQFGWLDAVPSIRLTPAGLPTPMTPEAFLAIQLGQLLVVAPLVNSLFTFGEEFGWRGYLLPKLLPLGARRALLVHGIVWGVWHWPIIGMGYNYGLDYPGAPWVGLLAMVAFTTVVGVFLGWLTLRSASVWPAVLGHAMINGAGGLGLVFVVGQPARLLGPAAPGLLAMLPWVVVAAWLLADETRLPRPAVLRRT